MTLASVAVLFEEAVDLVGRELGEPRDPSIGAELRGHHHSRFVLVFRVEHEPRLVVAVLATPICVRHPVRACLLKDLNHSRTRDRIRRVIVCDFDEEPRHASMVSRLIQGV